MRGIRRGWRVSGRWLSRGFSLNAALLADSNSIGWVVVGVGVNRRMVDVEVEVEGFTLKGL
jgi:hypothetical protein